MLARMKNTSLTRSIPFWLLLVLSLAAVAVGGWLVWDNTSTMQATLLDGTATNVEVYVGQAWITAGSGVLAAGVIGVLLALVLGAAKSLVPSAPVVVEEIDWTADTTETPETDANAGSSEESTETDAPAENEPAADEEDQNGSSGSTATDRKISVK